MTGKGISKSKLKAKVQLSVGKRHMKPTKDPMLGITKPALKRLARRGGVKRISAQVYNVMRKAIQDFLDNVIFRGLVIAQHMKKKTITVDHMVRALKSSGHAIYGFGRS
jgi:histone H4